MSLSTEITSLSNNDILALPAAKEIIQFQIEYLYKNGQLFLHLHELTIALAALITLSESDTNKPIEMIARIYAQSDKLRIKIDSGRERKINSQLIYDLADIVFEARLMLSLANQYTH